jgi:hypothetical protein
MLCARCASGKAKKKTKKKAKKKSQESIWCQASGRQALAYASVKGH